MEGAPLHCSRRPRTRHGPWGPLIHQGCPRPRIYHGRLNSLPRFLKPNVLSLPLVSPFPLGPSLGQGSLFCPGGHLLRCGGRPSRLLRPGGGRPSRLLRPGGRLSRLLRPGGRLSRLLRPHPPPTCQSHLTPPPTCQSHLTPPPTCQSRLRRPARVASADLPESPPPTCQSRLRRPARVASADLPESPPPTCQSRLRRPARVASADLPESPPPTCQSHLTPPPTCQSHLTPPPTCQSHLTSQRSTQCPFTSLLSRPPCPGGLLSHWPHMDLALRPLPRFHLRSTTLQKYALCKRLEAALRGGGSVMYLVTTHSNCTSPMDYISHHALHSHIPVHHYTNHTAVTIHSSTLIALPHLHLIHSLT